MANYFDQFDSEQPAAGGVNYFDQFDAPKAEKPRKKKSGFMDVPGFAMLPKMLWQLGKEAVTGKTESPENLVDINEVISDPFVRYAIGAGRPFLGGYQVAEKAIPGAPPVEPTLRALEQAKEEAGVGYDVAGLLGEVFNPVSLKVSKAFKPAAGFMDRVRQGAAVGGTYSLLSPTQGKEDEDFASEKAKQAVIGIALGGGIPAATSGVRYTGNLMSDLWKYVGSPNAARNLSDEKLREIIGVRNIPELIQAARQAREIVPGSRPTTAEAVAGLPEGSPIIALQQQVAGSPGGISAVFGRRRLEQEAARERLLRSQFGTPETLRTLEETADENARQAYGSIMSRTVSPQSDADILMSQVQRARGVPWTSAPAAAQAERTGMKFTPTTTTYPYVGQAGAIQQAGRAAQTEAQNRFLANNWLPVPGMPRVSPRYSPSTEVADEAAAAMRESLGLARTRGKETEFFENLLNRMDIQGQLSKGSLDPLVSRPSMVNAMEYASRLAKERNYKFPESPKDEFSLQNLHDIKLGLDAQISKGSAKGQPTSLDNTTLSAMEGTKMAFIDWVESKVPQYGKARTQFAKDMTLVDQQKVGQALIDRLRSVTGEETPGSFMRAVRDEAATIKKQTGQPRFTFEQLFNPRQREAVSSVVQDLERTLASVKPAQPTNLPGQENFAREMLPTLPHILSRPIVIANTILGTLSKSGGPLDRRMNEINALRMLNPKEFADALEYLPPEAKRSVLEGLRQQHGVSIMDQLGLGLPIVGTNQWARHDGRR